ncbi:MAG TPA: hypothetical protein DCY27_00180 [Desulfobacterales bacterium]|nr:hypothetical protein [Desulfobacterales bacterium]
MRPELKDTILNAFKKLAPGRLLDIPCGSAWLGCALNNDAWEYYGADLFSHPATPNFQRVNLDQNIPYEDGFFDYVVCFEGLEHLENYHHALREFYRILRGGGKLFISMPNILNIKSRKRYYYYGTFYGFPHLIKMPEYGEHLHITPINPSYLISFAQFYGFNLDKIYDIPINKKMYRFLISCFIIKSYIYLKCLLKPYPMKKFLVPLVSINLLLNDNLLFSFQKPLQVDCVGK